MSIKQPNRDDKARQQAPSHNDGTLPPDYNLTPTELRRGNNSGSKDGSSSADATQDLRPEIRPYREVELYARGGLGEVFRGIDPQLHRTVAIKRIQDCRANDEESRQRFLLEAEITARLEHPGVVPVFALLLEEVDRPAYVMRFVEGPTLWDVIRDHHANSHDDAFGLRRLLQTFVQICQTVALCILVASSTEISSPRTS